MFEWQKEGIGPEQLEPTGGGRFREKISKEKHKKLLWKQLEVLWNLVKKLDPIQ
jgi:hypothetical protein